MMWAQLYFVVAATLIALAELRLLGMSKELGENFSIRLLEAEEESSPGLIFGSKLIALKNMKINQRSISDYKLVLSDIPAGSAGNGPVSSDNDDSS